MVPLRLYFPQAINRDSMKRFKQFDWTEQIQIAERTVAEPDKHSRLAVLVSQKLLARLATPAGSSLKQKLMKKRG